MATAEAALYYADASALVKLVRDELETPALARFRGRARLVSSRLALAEVPRAMRRAIAAGGLGSDVLERADELLESIALLPPEPSILRVAGALSEPSLRTLDAVHVASALHAGPLDGFITYDVRQAAAARLCGLRTVAPGT